MGFKLIIPFIILVASSKASANNLLTTSPEKPHVRQQATLTCIYSGAEVREVRILVPNVKQTGEYLFKVALTTKNDSVKIEPIRKWKTADEYSVSSTRLNATGGQLQLTVKNLTLEDRLYYECVSFVPLMIRKAVIDVQGPPEVKSLQLFSRNSSVSWTTKAGQTVNITCVVNMGNPSANDSDIFLKVPGKAVGAGKVGKKVRYAYGLIIKTFLIQRTLQIADHGKLVECSGANSVGRGRKTRRLNILYGARDLRFSISSKTNLSAGDVIKCSANGNPTPKLRMPVLDQTYGDICWFSEEMTGLSKRVLKIPQNATLGRYFIACIAYNAFGHVFQEIAVNVFRNITILPMRLENLTLNGLVYRKCKVTDLEDRKWTYKWTFPNGWIQNSSILYRTSLQPSFSGVYRCTATSEHGLKLEASFRLNLGATTHRPRKEKLIQGIDRQRGEF